MTPRPRVPVMATMAVTLRAWFGSELCADVGEHRRLYRASTRMPSPARATSPISMNASRTDIRSSPHRRSCGAGQRCLCPVANQARTGLIGWPPHQQQRSLSRSSKGTGKHGASNARGYIRTTHALALRLLLRAGLSAVREHLSCPPAVRRTAEGDGDQEDEERQALHKGPLLRGSVNKREVACVAMSAHGLRAPVGTGVSRGARYFFRATKTPSHSGGGALSR